MADENRAAFNLSMEPDECQECGSPGNSICEKEIEELLKALDLCKRLHAKLGLAGVTLDTKLPLAKDLRTLGDIRNRVWSLHKHLIFDFQDLREKAGA